MHPHRRLVPLAQVGALGAMPTPLSVGRTYQGVTGYPYRGLGTYGGAPYHISPSQTGVYGFDDEGDETALYAAVGMLAEYEALLVDLHDAGRLSGEDAAVAYDVAVERVAAGFSPYPPGVSGSGCPAVGELRAAYIVTAGLDGEDEIPDDDYDLLEAEGQDPRGRTAAQIRRDNRRRKQAANGGGFFKRLGDWFGGVFKVGKEAFAEDKSVKALVQDIGKLPAPVGPVKPAANAAGLAYDLDDDAQAVGLYGDNWWWAPPPYRELPLAQEDFAEVGAFDTGESVVDDAHRLRSDLFVDTDGYVSSFR